MHAFRIEVEIAGRLTALLGEKAYPNRVKGVWGSVVAEEGLEPPTRGLGYRCSDQACGLQVLVFLALPVENTIGFHLI